MSLKPNVITQEELILQVKELKTLQTQLQYQLDQTQQKADSLKQSLQENEQIQKQLKTLMSESFQHFKEEWKRKSDFYPDIRFHILEQAVEALAPPKK